MRTLEALHKLIETTEDLRSIVRTMKALAAVSIHHYDAAARSIVTYEETIHRGFQILLKHPEAPRLRPPAKGGPQGMIVFGSDHGLCGRFNEVAVEAALQALVQSDAGDAPRRLILAAGLRAAARLEAMGCELDEALALPGSVGGLSATVHAVLLTLDRWRSDHGVTRVLLCHNRRTEAAAAVPGTSVLFPIDVERLRRLAERRWPTRMLPTFTMAPEPLLAALVRQQLNASLYRACAESQASEHASRLASMQAAERNIVERLDELQADYRRRRQDTITAELLDLVAGFESLRSPAASPRHKASSRVRARDA